MNYVKLLISLLVVGVVIGGMKMDVSAFLGLGNSVSWKEEVLLHDGQKIIVERSQTRGGRHEIGQSPPVKEHSITFTLPGTDKTIRWTSEYSEDIGRTNFNLLALHVLSGTPYLITEPNLCLSYNKWGRPNPPYVLFRYDGSSWQRIPFDELPAVFTTINLVINTISHEKKVTATKLVPNDMIRQFNSSLKQEYLKSIIRTPLPPGSVGVSCERLEYYKGAWVGPGNSIGRKLMDMKTKTK